MNPQVHVRRLAARVGLANRQQWILRVTAALASLGFLVLLAASGGGFHPLPSAALVLLTLLVMVLPETSAPMFLMLGLSLLWTISRPDRLDGWTLAAAADLLGLHLACTLASYGPPQVELDRGLFLLWARRAAMMLAVTAVVWLAARLLESLSLPAAGLVVVVALALLLGWTAFLSARLLTRDGVPPS